VDAKEVAARRAVEYVQDGMTLGLGTGSTATFAIQALGERIKQEGLHVRGVPTSSRSRELAEQFQIPLADLSDVDGIDLTMDGADELDPAFNLIKGGGGALLREKLVAAASREVLIICDETKLHPALGAFPLPVAIVPFGWKSTLRRLQTYCQTLSLREAKASPGQPYITDDGLYIVDMHLGAIRDPVALEKNLKRLTGVVEVGLFIGLATRVIVGYPEGRFEEKMCDK
jgi:ribose 5-phosphate isomerase A